MYKNKILSNLSWLSLQDIPTQFLGIFFFTFLGRQQGQFGIGSYSYVFSVLAIVNLVIDFGLNNYFWRRWSADPTLIRGDESLYITSKAIALVLATIPFLGYIVLFDYGLWSFFLLAFIYTILDIPRSLPILSLQSTNTYKSVFFINMTDRVLAFGSGTLLLVLGYSLHAALIAFVLARICSILVGFYQFGHIPKMRWEWTRSRKLLVENKHVFLITILSYLYFKVDVVVMRRILGVDAVGMYSSAYRILDTLAMAPNLVLFAVFPSLAHMAHHQDDRSTSQVMEKAIKYLLIIAVFAALICQFYSKEILSFLYHNTFLPAAPTLAVLGWTGVLIFATTPLVYLHLAQKNDRLLVQRLIFLTIFNVGLNLFLLPLLGIIGAAYATLITEAVSAAILLRHSRIRISLWWLPRLFVCTAITAFFFLLVHPPLFLMASLAFICYIALLYVVKIIDIADIKMV